MVLLDVDRLTLLSPIFEQVSSDPDTKTRISLTQSFKKKNLRK
jgi:hypothetical protein